MSTARTNNLDLMPPPLARAIQQRSLLVGGLFSVLAIIGLLVNRDEFFHAYLTAFMAWLGVTLGCMAMLMVIHMTGGAWGMVIRRMLEAGMRTLPFMAALFIPLIFGIKHLYGWAHPERYAHDPHLVELTRHYLSTSGYILRAVLYFALLLALAYLLDKYSALQDSPPELDLSPRFRMIAGPGLIVYGFAISFAVIDWVLSISAPWVSTIYPLIFVAGECLSALCFVVIVESILARHLPLNLLLKPKEIQDHGNLILAWVMLWAYFSFSQFLITWAGNLPDEISWYTRRLYEGWGWIPLWLVLFHFAVPFVLLLSRSFKRRTETMMWLAAWLMVMRYVDLFWFIEPNYHPSITASWQHIIMPFAIGGFWLWLYFRNLSSRPLLPLYDPNSRSVLEAEHE